MCALKGEAEKGEQDKGGETAFLTNQSDVPRDVPDQGSQPERIWSVVPIAKKRRPARGINKTGRRGGSSQGGKGRKARGGGRGALSDRSSDCTRVDRRVSREIHCLCTKGYMKLD